MPEMTTAELREKTAGRVDALGYRHETEYYKSILAALDRLDRAEARIKELEGNMWCSYCGKEFPFDTATGDQLREHIHVCEKHPLAKAEARVRALTELIAGAVDLLEHDQPIAAKASLRAVLEKRP